MQTKDRIIESSFIAVVLLFFFQEFNGTIIRIDLLAIAFFCSSSLLLDLKGIRSLLGLKIYKLFGAFVGYTFLVNIFYALTHNHPLYLFHSFLYFGLLIFCMCFHSLLRKNENQTLQKLLSLSVIPLTIITIYMLFFEKSNRASAFFENPNQAGIYALYLSCLSTIAFLPQIKAISKNTFTTIGVLTVFIILSSLSRASIMAAAAIFLINLFVFHKTALLYPAIGILLYLLSSGGFIQQNIKESPGLKYRFLEERSHDDHPLNRGYTRFSNYPQYLLFGAGEREQHRFNDDFEFHSSYGNILFSYGILGFSIFLLFYKEAFYPFSWIHLLLIPILFHSLFHNDIRNIFLWIISITLFFYKNSEK